MSKKTKVTPNGELKQTEINQMKSVESDTKEIILVNSSEFDSFEFVCESEIAVIMPCIDTTLGVETAKFLKKRAGIECFMVVVNDDKRFGFISVLNQTAAKINPKYVVYVAQDAYPGINWLKIAYNTLEKTGNGLLAFNDGKWRGRVASFGMVRMEWVKGLYGGSVFYPEYKAHKADNELTVIARAQNKYDYNPDATLIEVDKHKVFYETVPEDKDLFRSRYRSGFDGLLDKEILKRLSDDYIVTMDLLEVKMPQKLQTSKYLFNFPRVVEKPYDWLNHTPFAFYLVEKLKPKVLVELGASNGNSYFSFCQVINDLKLDSKCFWVNTWDDMNDIPRDIFSRINKNNSEFFANISTLQRMTFTNALNYQGDESVDILHLNGIRSYNELKQTFNSWLPKLSKRAILILHETIKQNGFEGWKLLEELKDVYPSFEFTHGNGLGVLCIGKNVDLRFLEFVNEANNEGFVKLFFANLGQSVLKEYEKQDTLNNLNSLKNKLSKTINQIEEKENELREKIDELNRYQKIIPEKNQKIAELNASISAIEETIKKKETTLVKLKESIKEKEADMDSIMSEKEKLSRTVDGYKREINNLRALAAQSESQINELKYEQEKITKEVSLKAQTIEKLNNEIVKNQNEIETKKLENVKLNKWLQQKEVKITELEIELNTLKNKLKAKVSEIDELQVSLAEYKSISISRGRSISILETKLEELQNDNNETKEALNIIQETLKKKETELIQLKESIHKKELSIEEHSISKVKLLNEIETKKREIASIRAFSSQSESLANELKEELEKAKRNIHAKNELIEQWKIQINEYQLQLEKSNSELKNKKALLLQTEAKAIELEEELINATKENQEKTSAIKELSENLEAKQNLAANRGRRITVLETRIDDLIVESDELKLKLNNYQQTISLLSSDLSIKNGQITELNRIAGHNESQILNLERQVERYREATAENQGKLYVVTSSLAETKKVLQNRENKIKSLNYTIATHERTIQEQIQHAKQINQLLEEEKNRSHKLNDELTSKIALIQKLEGIINEETQTSFTLKQQVEELHISSSEIQEKLQDSFQKIDSLNTLINDKNLNIKELSNELEGLKRERENLQEQNYLQNNRIETLLSDIVNLKDNQKKQIEELKSTIEKKDATINALGNRKEQIENELFKLYSSFSWRLTHPLRKLTQILNKLKIIVLWSFSLLMALLSFNKHRIRKSIHFFRFRNAIIDSGLFDTSWYLKTYTDVAKKGLDPVAHYIYFGADEGRNPSPKFSTIEYIKYNEDVKNSNINPLVHYILYGKKEGRFAFEVEEININSAVTNEKYFDDSTLNTKPNTKFYSINETKLLERVREYNAQKDKRKAKVVIFTAITGDYDSLIIPESIVNEWDYVVFTENPISGEHIFRVLKPTYNHEDPTRVARYIKTHPHILFQEYEFAVWVDSNILVKGSNLTENVDSFIQNKSNLMLLPHSSHATLKQEFDKCIELKKDNPNIINKQRNRYKNEGLPLSSRVFETGIFVCMLNNEKVKELFESWWDEIDKGSRRDQLSLPFVIWKLNFKYEEFKGIDSLWATDSTNFLLFNHKNNKKNKLPFYEPPSFVTTKIIDNQAKKSNRNKYDHIQIKQLRHKLIERAFIDRSYSELLILTQNFSNPHLQSLAAWELILWHADKMNIKDAEKALEFFNFISPKHFSTEYKRRYNIVQAECMLICNKKMQAKQLIENTINEDENENLLLAIANLEPSNIEKENHINRIYKKYGLSEITIAETNGNNVFDSLRINQDVLNSITIKPNSPKVSVLMSVYNAEKVITTALDSLINQSYKNIEIIIVDDGSTDNTYEIVERYKKIDSRIQIIKQKENQGTYTARNIALSKAKGELVTCMDSDDWSHPEKIAFQVKHLQDNQNIIGNISQWTRATNELLFRRRRFTGDYILNNVSSLMFWRKKVVERIGYWDSVRFGADTEYLKRLQITFGTESIIYLPPVPLSFARFTQESITANPLTGFPGFYMGSRKDYCDSYSFFHKKTKNLKYSFPQNGRPFPVSKALLPSTKLEKGIKIKLDLLIILDSRLNDKTLIDFLKSQNEKKVKIGLLDLETFDLNRNLPFDQEIREIIDGEIIQTVVFGEEVSCDEVVIWHYLTLSDRQGFIPEVKSQKISVLISELPADKKTEEFMPILKKCMKNLREYFGVEGAIYPIDETLIKQFNFELFNKYGLNFNAKKWIFKPIDKKEPKVSNEQNKGIPKKGESISLLESKMENSSQIERKTSDIKKSKIEPQKSEIRKKENDLLKLAKQRIETLKVNLYNYGFIEKALKELQNEIKSDSNPYLQMLAAREFSRYHAMQATVEGAEKFLELYPLATKHEKSQKMLRMLSLVQADCFHILGDFENAKKAIKAGLEIQKHADLYLFSSNLETEVENRVNLINNALGLYGIPKIYIETNLQNTLYDSLNAEKGEYLHLEELIKKHKITVTMPAFNAESTIPIAIKSVLNQTWYNLELIVIDDCSCDRTYDVAKEFSKTDDRIIVLRTEKNSGPYVARNMALSIATGEFVTCNDSDDWSHPNKLQIQALHLIENPSILGNTSEQARATSDLFFKRWVNYGMLIHTNTSSFMFRREPVIKKIGYLDSVRFGADNEYIFRIQKSFGESSTAKLSTGPLSFQRQSSSSLVDNEFFGIRANYMGARKAYLEGYQNYQEKNNNLFVEFPPKKRHFFIPGSMHPEKKINQEFDAVIVTDIRNEINKSRLVNDIKRLTDNGLHVGLVHLSRYDFETEDKVIPEIREMLDGGEIQLLVYGEESNCEYLVVYDCFSLLETQKYVPFVKANEVLLVIDSEIIEFSKNEYSLHEVISRCTDNANSYFENKGLWYPFNNQARECILQLIGNVPLPIGISSINYSLEVILNGIKAKSSSIFEVFCDKINKTSNIELANLNASILNEQVAEYKSNTAPALTSIVLRLIADAEEAIGRGLHSVTDKTTLPPSGNPNDYWHPHPYWWPNPDTPNGLPYIKRDGERAPGTRMYEPDSDKFDRTRLQRVFDDSMVLSLAWKFTNEQKYAIHAASILERFFVNPKTRMNPHLNYAQVRLGRNKNLGSSTGIIEMKDFYYYLDSVRIVRDAGFISDETYQGFTDWLVEYLDWLLNSPLGKEECNRANNHGTYYDLQVASIAAFLNNKELINEVLKRSLNRIPVQFADDGSQPEELRRTITAHYCCFNLQGWVNLAELFSRYGIDLWEYQPTCGGNLVLGSKWFLSYFGEEWPYQQIEEFDQERFFPILFSTPQSVTDGIRKKGLNKLMYDINSLFNPHDGIRPYWNIAGKRSIDQVRKQDAKQTINNLKLKLETLGFEGKPIDDIYSILKNSEHLFAKQLAAREIILWHCNKRTPDDARKCLELLPLVKENEEDSTLIRQTAILEAECLELVGNITEAKTLLANTFEQNPHADLLLALSNLYRTKSNKLRIINSVFDTYNLSHITYQPDISKSFYDTLTTERISSNHIKNLDSIPKVSIIIPSYNAEMTIETTIESLLKQTWPNIEILVVDDCSSDSTIEVVNKFLSKTNIISILKTLQNSGPYTARNIALQEATGDFITCNDSDDWSHPEKIEKQVIHLIMNPNVIANTSQQARATSDLRIHRRGNYGRLIFENMSSLMFRRIPVLEKIGFWDSVRFAADNEFIHRLRKVFGKHAVVTLTTGPLSFQRQADGSLTTDGAFGFHGFYMGARKEYFDAHSFFHSQAGVEDFLYKYPMKNRPFAIPEPMQPTREEKVEGRRIFDVVYVNDFRIEDENLREIITEARNLYKKGLRIGLVQMSKYDLDPRKKINPEIRNLLNKKIFEFIVFGEKVSCKDLIIRDPETLLEKQRYVPCIEPEIIVLKIGHKSHSGKTKIDFVLVQQKITEYFGKNANIERY